MNSTRAAALLLAFSLAAFTPLQAQTAAALNEFPFENNVPLKIVR